MIDRWSFNSMWVDTTMPQLSCDVFGLALAEDWEPLRGTNLRLGKLFH